VATHMPLCIQIQSGILNANCLVPLLLARSYFKCGIKCGLLLPVDKVTWHGHKVADVLTNQKYNLASPKEIYEAGQAWCQGFLIAVPNWPLPLSFSSAALLRLHLTRDSYVGHFFGRRSARKVSRRRCVC